MDGKFVNDDATAHREARLAFRKIVETSEVVAAKVSLRIIFHASSMPSWTCRFSL